VNLPPSNTSLTEQNRVIIFSGLRLTYLPSNYDSPNPGYDGIPAAIYGICEVYASLVTATTPLLKSFMIRFRVLGAKREVIPVSRAPYNGSGRSKQSDLNNPNSKDVEKGSRGKLRGKKQLEQNSLAGYEQWMPTESESKRHDSHCGDTDVTLKTDDEKSERTLHTREKEKREREQDQDTIGLAEAQ
jgi:hypothetical protein